MCCGEEGPQISYSINLNPWLVTSHKIDARLLNLVRYKAPTFTTLVAAILAEDVVNVSHDCS